MGKHTPHVRQLELNYLVGIFVADHLTRMHEAFDGDLVAALVLATIANRNMERYYEDVARRSAEGLDRLVEQRAHVGQLRHSNAHSVASATGIPRETVRRKVKWLVERGWIRVGERGELSIAEGIAQQFAQFNGETVERFLDTARRSLDIAGRPVATPQAADADVSQPQKS
jgi:hypothetical protein